MELIRFDDPSAFLDKARPFLDEHEVECGLLLGCVVEIAKDPDRFDEVPFLAALFDGNRVVGAALRMPPRPLISTPMPDEARRMLCRTVADAIPDLPGVVGPSVDAGEFARLWSERTGRPHRQRMPQTIYVLRRVRDVPTAPGGFRLAADADAKRLTVWARDFIRDVGHEEEEPLSESFVRDRVADKRLAVWEDGEPVAMIGWAGPTRTGIRIAPVYTPPDMRGRGYATSLTAATCRRLLDGGKAFCFLYADRGNPVSNAVYRTVGFEPHSEAAEYVFDTTASS